MDKIARYEIRPYQGEAGAWNEFAARSRNATFLFDRRYMDYHADRFRDCSWVALKNGKPAALLPANFTPEGVLQSHGGLTYGGWILPPGHIDGADVLEIFRAAIEEWGKKGIKKLDYKPLPYIYASQPSQEDIYALSRLGGRMTECSLSSAIDTRQWPGFNKQMRRHLKEAEESGVEIISDIDVREFMNMLEKCLKERHGVRPVHTAEEMERLHTLFPERIRFYGAYLEKELHAGVCIYDTGLVAHAQYIASSPTGREKHLLPLLFHRLIEEYKSRRYFDFGISTEDHGKILNSGLLRQKFSYGATGLAQTRWELDLESL